MEQTRIILASGSPRRRELLQQAGVEFTVQTSDVDESYPPDMPPAEVAPFLAAAKAHAVADKLDAPATVIGADTIVALGSRIYGKPTDEADARRMLAELSGRTHQVITGVCIITASSEQCFAEATDVTFRELDADEIAAYVAGGEPLDKAGAYGIQGDGGALVDHIEGDYDNVVGLPAARVAAILCERGGA